MQFLVEFSSCFIVSGKLIGTKHLIFRLIWTSWLLALKKLEVVSISGEEKYVIS